MTLHEWGLFHKTDKATFHGYCDFYQEHIGNPRSILEFGVKDGASLKMWRDAYPEASVIGMDINPAKPIIGVQVLMRDCLEGNICHSKHDLIIDDASHNTLDQITTFGLWWEAVNKGGAYLVEDVHTQHFTQYNPTKIDFHDWLISLDLPFEYFWRMPEDHSDSGTVIIYKK